MLVGCKAEMSLLAKHFQLETHHNNNQVTGPFTDIYQPFTQRQGFEQIRRGNKLNSRNFDFTRWPKQMSFLSFPGLFYQLSHFRRTEGCYEGKSLIFQRGKSRPRYYFRYS